MAGTQRYQPSTTIEPTPVVPDTTSRLAAAQWDKLAWGADQYKGQFIRQMEDDALRRAEENAPQVVTRDGQGVLVPPESFDPKGFAGPTYAARFRQVAANVYLQAASNDYRSSAAEAMAANPTNPAAVGKVLDEKYAAMTRALDPAALPKVSAELQMIKSQAMSSALAAGTRAQLKQLSEDTERDINQFSIEAAQSRVDVAKLMTTDDEALSPTERVFKQRWARLEKNMESMGDVPEQIAARRNRATLFIRARATSDDYAGQLEAAARGPGGPEAVSLLAANLKADAYKQAQGQGRYESEYYSFLTARIDLAAQVASARAVGAAADKERELAQTQARFLDMERRGVDPAEIAREKAKLAEATMSDPSLTPKERLSRMQAYRVAGDPLAGSMYERQLAPYVAQAQDMSLTPQQRAYAADQISQVVSSPTAQLVLGPRAQAYQQIATQQRVDEKMASLPEMATEMARGLPPAEIDRVRRQWMADGRLTMRGDGGTLSYQQFQSMANASAVAYEKKKGRVDAQTAAQGQWERAGAPMPAEVAKTFAEDGHIAPLRGKFDPENPQHFGQALADFSRYGVVRPDMIDALTSYRFEAASPEGIDAIYQLTQNMKDIWIKQNKTGGAAGELAATAWMSELMGKERYNHVVESKKAGSSGTNMWNVAKAPVSASRSLHDKPEAQTAIDDLIKGIETNGAAMWRNTWSTGAVSEWWRGDDNARHFRAVIQNIGNRYNQRPGLMSQIVGFGSVASMFDADRMVVTEEARAHITKVTKRDMLENSHLYETKGQDGINSALVVGFTKASHGLGIVVRDGVPTLELKPMEEELSRLIGLPVSSEMAVGAMRLLFPGSGVGPGPGYDEKKFSIVTREDDRGVKYQLIGQYKGDINKIVVGEMYANDPIMKEKGMALAMSFADGLRDGRLTREQAGYGVKVLESVGFIFGMNPLAPNTELKWASRMMNGAFDKAFQSAEMRTRIEALQNGDMSKWTDTVLAVRAIINADGQHQMTPEQYKAWDYMARPEFAQYLAKTGVLHSIVADRRLVMPESGAPVALDPTRQGRGEPAVRTGGPGVGSRREIPMPRRFEDVVNPNVP